MCLLKHATHLPLFYFSSAILIFKSFILIKVLFLLPQHAVFHRNREMHLYLRQKLSDFVNLMIVRIAAIPQVANFIAYFGIAGVEKK